MTTTNRYTKTNETLYPGESMKVSAENGAGGNTRSNEVLRSEDVIFSYSQEKNSRRDQAGIGPLDFTLRQGEITALIGASGCGKSTTLKLLAGILRPKSGHVWYAGTDIACSLETKRAKLRRTKFAFVFQDYMLIDSLTVAENVTLPMSLDKKLYDMNVMRRALAYVGLDEGLANAHVSALSGGQRQRVAIARALMMRADVLFADEPTGNLDPKARDETLSAIDAAMKSGLKTCLLVTHDPQVAARADRVFFMRDGRIDKEFLAMSAADVEALLLGK
ncbi:ABC transporter ATP-binding protein [Bifidobacterium sp. ESL0784]|uniref:ABC transporter ATP-binding protein n=1 Tax=Bifidobacterium sp. ESL0784 TaxID=2983231 RepID=UPI0023F804F9|nr:ABC transporter ATP-binding protein [Bifidobacterium sp. ESL0784]MDF7640901.1 ABC transporter ATP-binding protein [Bifidobacterium sp. ESL0784]